MEGRRREQSQVAPVSQNLVAIGAGNSAGAGVLPFATLQWKPGFVTMVQQLAAGDQETRLSITQDIRRAVAKQHDPPIQEAIDAGVIPAMARARTRTCFLFVLPFTCLSE